MIATWSCSDFACAKTRRVLVPGATGEPTLRCSCGRVMGRVLFDERKGADPIAYEAGSLGRGGAIGS